MWIEPTAQVHKYKHVSTNMYCAVGSNIISAHSSTLCALPHQTHRLLHIQVTHECRRASGKTREADIIITATGLDLQMLGGMEVRIDNQAMPANTAMTYKFA